MTIKISDTGFCYKNRTSLETLNIIVRKIVKDTLICETEDGDMVDVHKENFIRMYIFRAPRKVL